MAVINYGDDPVLTREKVEYRNPLFWRGEVERGFDYIVCDRPEIVKAYEAQGVIHVDHELNPVKGQDKETSTTPTDGEAHNMTWPQLKSAASKKAGRNVKTKAEALEVLQQ